uniref:Beta-1,4-N-acetylgalactosaminyltransferase n=1 Tax=Lynceus sp. MCZ IZ 141354 TaxID=1930659 RepID=A0A9N6WTB2_9CRUS|nr:EOG090X0AZ6 [Lynceus sp. MCZ IZ 141354]
MVGGLFDFIRTHYYKVLLVLLFACVATEYLFNVIYESIPPSRPDPYFSYNLTRSVEVYFKGNVSMVNSTAVPLNFSATTLADFARENSTSSSMALTLNESLSISANISNDPSLCPLISPFLVGRSAVKKTAPPMDELERLITNVNPGGCYRPLYCTARHRVAIVIPYRNREEHLRVFLENMHPFLQRQQLDYGIFVVEQAGTGKFNRAMLMNIGAAEALKSYDYQCLIFHDVDLVPEDDTNLYSCPEQPRHMSVAIDVFQYKLPYETIFGGVSAMSKSHFEQVNGFSNLFWGWGGEDDDMSNRIRHNKLVISRYPANVARYSMLTHKKASPNPERYKYLKTGLKRANSDGLNSLKYKRLDLVLKRLYTWILVEIKPP